MADLKLKFIDLEGMIDTVTVAPTHTPTKLQAQILIYIDNLTTPTVKRLYIYSHKAKIWNYVTLV